MLADSPDIRVNTPRGNQPHIKGDDFQFGVGRIGSIYTGRYPLFTRGNTGLKQTASSEPVCVPQCNTPKGGRRCKELRNYVVDPEGEVGPPADPRHFARGRWECQLQLDQVSAIANEACGEYDPSRIVEKTVSHL